MYDYFIVTISFSKNNCYKFHVLVVLKLNRYELIFTR